jgi:hypothetical protein
LQLGGEFEQGSAVRNPGFGLVELECRLVDGSALVDQEFDGLGLFDDIYGASVSRETISGRIGAYSGPHPRAARSLTKSSRRWPNGPSGPWTR